MESRFIVDGMLGSLARKLRIYGFDTLYDASLNDNQLVRLAHTKQLILLTSDRELFAKALRSGIQSILLTEENDAERLVTVFRTLKVSSGNIDAEKSRCASCNGELLTTDRSDLKSSLPDIILKRHEQFYVCKNCGKVYWKGGHWRRLESLAREVSKSLERSVKLIRPDA